MRTRPHRRAEIILHFALPLLATGFLPGIGTAAEKASSNEAQKAARKEVQQETQQSTQEEPRRQTEDPTALEDALKGGRFGVALRYRYELVSDDAFDKDGHASTLRTTIHYESGSFRRLGAYVEFEDVSDLGLGNRHNNAGVGDLSNGVTDRPVIADPEITEINQAYAAYQGIRDTDLRVGRTELALDDERFVGPVGWRQNHQSFDVAKVSQTSLPRTEIHYVYLDRVNRIFGDSKRMNSHLGRLVLDAGGAGKIVPYLYLLDYRAAADAGLSTLTYGASWAGTVGVRESFSVPFHLQMARQQDAGDNPGRVDAVYFRGELGARTSRLWGRLGAEILEGSAADGQFSTPLATLHKWNGWADKFLSTPRNGLQDYFVTVGGAWRSWKGNLVGHRFQASATGSHYGNEIDGALEYQTRWKQSLAVTIAYYAADELFANTFKMMLWTSYGF